jgi:hypothetical protein
MEEKMNLRMITKNKIIDLDKITFIDISETIYNSGNQFCIFFYFNADDHYVTSENLGTYENCLQFLESIGFRGLLPEQLEDKISSSSTSSDEPSHSERNECTVTPDVA